MVNPKPELVERARAWLERIDPKRFQSYAWALAAFAEEYAQERERAVLERVAIWLDSAAEANAGSFDRRDAYCLAADFARSLLPSGSKEGS